MTRPRERGKLRPQTATRLIVVRRIELSQAGEQALEVPGMSGMYDVEIKRRNRCTAEDSRDTADDDQLDVMPG
jgi:hypothetical protein